jgi:hypothetical protein
LSAAEQVLINELRTIGVRINNLEPVFREAALNPEVDQNTLYELMEADGKEKTQLIEAAYATFRAAKD